jgi:hypothetical protein
MDEMLTLYTVPMRPFIETNPLRKGGPLCLPERIDTVLLFVDVDFDVDVDANAALAGWMHCVRADLAGCYENPVWCLVRLRWFVTECGLVGRPSPTVTTGSFCNELLVLTIDDGARPGNRRMSTCLQSPAADMSGSRHTRSSFHPASRCSV